MTISEVIQTKCQLLTVKDVAEILSTSVRTVWRLRSCGKLPEPITFGGCIRWQRSAIEKWIEMGAPSAEEFNTRMEKLEIIPFKIGEQEYLPHSFLKQLFKAIGKILHYLMPFIALFLQEYLKY